MRTFLLLVFLLLLSLPEKGMANNPVVQQPSTTSTSINLTSAQTDALREQLVEVRIQLGRLDEQLKLQQIQGSDVKALQSAQQGLKTQLANLQTQFTEQEKNHNTRINGFDSRTSDLKDSIDWWFTVLTLFIALIGFVVYKQSKKEALNVAEEKMDAFIEEHTEQIIDKAKNVVEARLKEADSSVAELKQYIDEAHRLLQEKQQEIDEAFENVQQSIVEKTEPDPESLRIIERSTRKVSKEQATVEELFKLASVSYGKKDYQQALELFNKAIAAAKNQDVDDVLFARVLLNKAFTLHKLKKLEDEIETYNALISRFKSSNRTHTDKLVSIAMFNKGVTLGGLKLLTEAIDDYEQLITRFENSNNEEVLQRVAMAMFNKGITQGQLEMHEQAIDTYDALITRFDNSDNEEILQQVAMAMLNKGVAQGRLEMHEQAIDTYEQLITGFDNLDNEEVLQQIAMAMLNKGLTQGQREMHEQAIDTYDALITRFDNSDNKDIELRVVKAMCNKGAAQGRLKMHEKEIHTYEQLITRFENSDNKEVLQQVAIAMFNKGITQGQREMHEQAIDTYDALISRFGNSNNEDIQLCVVKAMLNKGITQGRLGKLDAAIQSFDLLFAQYKDSQNEQISSVLANMLANVAEIALLHEPPEQVRERIERAQHYITNKQYLAVLAFIQYLLDDVSIASVFTAITATPTDTKLTWQFAEIRTYLEQFEGEKQSHIQAVVAFFEQHQDVKTLAAALGLDDSDDAA
ncbi:tetratricopeptide repeat protein [Pseudoalteromonas sp. T1lg23B]|uniref:tetratricopeptide repeat protein n=1 Tax=Pseudoalteromonas sp. T1lg23B TaxID=2077097 RepID=UPI000CF72CB5|nr:tetratricopeptide repeat protein [Pseudoalteromonas sp. T1lg23B]